jgi:hypothetical protein
MKSCPFEIPWRSCISCGVKLRFISIVQGQEMIGDWNQCFYLHFLDILVTKRVRVCVCMHMWKRGRETIDLSGRKLMNKRLWSSICGGNNCSLFPVCWCVQKTCRLQMYEAGIVHLAQQLLSYLKDYQTSGKRVLSITCSYPSSLQLLFEMIFTVISTWWVMLKICAPGCYLICL